MLMIDPPPESIISGTACLHINMVPRTLTAWISSHIATSMLTTSKSKAALSVTPALLSSTSSRPWVPFTPLSSASTLASALISTTRVSNRSSADTDSRNGPKSVPGRSAATTVEPKSISVRTVADPIPPAAPVTSETVPARSLSLLTLEPFSLGTTGRLCGWR